MRNIIRTFICALALTVAVIPSASAQKKMKNADVAKDLEGYFTLATSESVVPDGQGFIRRWMLLDPISKPNSSNRVFTDSYTRESIMHEYFPDQLTVMPKDGDVETVEMEYQTPVDLNSVRPTAKDPNEGKIVKSKLYWHALDSDHFFVKLFRFATGLGKDRYGVIFWAVTVINCDEDIENVRLSVGSNCGSMWWLNGEEQLLLATDRHMAVDNATSKKITLHKGKNVLRCATINGVGMSEFCARFLDETGKPITNFTVSCE